MERFFLSIKNISDGIAQNYNLDLQTFLIIYLISFIPFYLGYFLIIYGTTRHLRWKDFFNFKSLNGGLHWDQQATVGLIIHLIGRIMPYVYVLVLGKNLPVILEILLWAVVVVSVLLGIYKFISHKRHEFPQDIEVLKKEDIDDHEVEKLWKIYNDTFEPLNKISPCRQSLDYDHFIHSLHDRSVLKYLINKKDIGLIGIGLITNEFKNTPWISDDYFNFKFPSESLDRVTVFGQVIVNGGEDSASLPIAEK